MNQNPPQQQINIELGEKEAEGIYSNLALISHSAAEFVFDFTRMVPGVPKARVYARIIMTPQHAKSLLAALRDNISKYENQFGEIKVHNDPLKGPRSIGFKTEEKKDDKSGQEPAKGV
ncbi:DUF3467 domain-containing protein [candidate division KSB1 bacterium]|nr:DUF3467 domain-containing protein [candidate division KSB1 bacterium]